VTNSELVRLTNVNTDTTKIANRRRRGGGPTTPGEIERANTRVARTGTVTYGGAVPINRGVLRVRRGQGEILNISEGGLCVLTDKRLAPKMLLAVRVALEGQELSIPTLAYVRWSKPVRGTGHYAAGLMFMV
jgi:hypothetical protein